MRITQITTVTVRDCRDSERCILRNHRVVLKDLSPEEESCLRQATEILHIPLQVLEREAIITAHPLSSGTVQFQVGHSSETRSFEALEALKKLLRSKGAKVRSHTVTSGGRKEYQNRF